MLIPRYHSSSSFSPAPRPTQSQLSPGGPSARFRGTRLEKHDTRTMSPYNPDAMGNTDRSSTKSNRKECSCCMEDGASSESDVSKCNRSKKRRADGRLKGSSA
eukprot:1952947-Rhodomonas_salina.1